MIGFLSNKKDNSPLITPWKIGNEVTRLAVYPYLRVLFALNQIEWKQGWKLYGIPIIQRCRGSIMKFGLRLQLRSALRSNPLGPNHPVFFTTWQSSAILEIGDDFGMTGGTICASERIQIGDRVTVGANTTIIDTDFHPLFPQLRRDYQADAQTSPVVIEDDVFIGMNSLILKGVTLGCACVVGAGSVVTQDVMPGSIVAGNPARFIKQLADAKVT